MPADSTAALMAELERVKLENLENLQLRNQSNQSGEPGKENNGTTNSAPAADANPPTPAPVAPATAPAHGVQPEQPPTVPPATAGQRPLATYSVGSSKPVLENSRPSSHTLSITAWLKKQLSKSQFNQLEEKIQVLDGEIEKAGVDAPSVDRMLTAWGLGVQAASKLSHPNMLRLLAAVNMMRN